MKVLLSFLLLLPATALALTYERQSLLYTDAPFRPAEAAGISILTSLQAVEGYPDGSFRPERTLNRAEFLKIALASVPNIRVSSSDANHCFPDVPKKEWFSPFVCLAKKRGIVSGYPDGMFKPENPVNYAEALKMLGELYGYTAYAEPDAEWWQIYVQAAQNHKTLLPIQMTYDRFITRGQMARLAAAYRAEFEGELDLYRRMEKGEDIFVSSSSSLSAVASSSSQISASVEAKEDSSSSTPTPIPTTSHILLIGTEQSIGDALLYPQQRDTHLRILKVVLEREARSLKQLMLKDSLGVEIAVLKLDVHDRDNKTWIAELPGGSGSYVFSGGEGTRVIVVAALRDWNTGGFAEDSIKIRSLFVIMGKVDNPEETYQVVPTGAHYPWHQTALARITSVESTFVGTGTLVSGAQQQVAAFRFIGEATGGLSALAVEHLRFRVRADRDVLLRNPTIKSGSSAKHLCSTDSEDSSIVNCVSIPSNIGSVEGIRIIEFSADITASEAQVGASLQIQLETPGSMNESGDVRFTDGSASFNWMEGKAPLAVGKMWVK